MAFTFGAKPTRAQQRRSVAEKVTRDDPRRDFSNRRSSDVKVQRVLDEQFTDFSSTLREKASADGISLRQEVAHILFPTDDGKNRQVSTAQVARMRYAFADSTIAEKVCSLLLGDMCFKAIGWVSYLPCTQLVVTNKFVFPLYFEKFLTTRLCLRHEYSMFVFVLCYMYVNVCVSVFVCCDMLYYGLVGLCRY